MKINLTTFRPAHLFLLLAIVSSSFQSIQAQSPEVFSMMPGEVLTANNPDEEGGPFNQPKGLESVIHNRKVVYVAYKSFATGKYLKEFVYEARPGTDIVAAGYKAKYNSILVLLNDGSIARIDADQTEDWGMPHTVVGTGLAGYILQLIGDDLYTITNDAVYVLRDTAGPWKIDTAGLDNSQPYEIAIDSSQNVWLSTDNGIFMQALTDSVWTKKTGTNSTLGVNVDKQQRIWATGNGVLKVSNNGGAFANGPTGITGEYIIKVVSDWLGNVYALTGGAYYLKSGNKIYYSAGGTQTFTRIDQTMATDFASFEGNIYNDITADSQLIVATVAGLHATANAGATWTLTGGPVSLRSGGIVRTNDNQLLASGPSGLYKGNAGNWVKKFPVTGYQEGLQVYRDGQGNLYTHDDDFAKRHLIYKSTNNGDTWNLDTAGIAASDITLGNFYVDENGTQHASSTVYEAGLGNRYAVWKKETGQPWVLDTLGLPVIYNSATVFSFNSDGQGNIFLCLSLNVGATTYKRALGGTLWTVEAALGPAKVAHITWHGTQVVAATSEAIIRKNSGTWQQLSYPAGINGLDVLDATATFDSKGVLWVYYENFTTSSPVKNGKGFFYTTDFVNWRVPAKNVTGDIFSGLVAIGDSVFALPRGSSGVYVLDTGGTTQPNAIFETENIGVLNILPNPVSSNLQITLQLTKAAQTEISILDMTGKVVGQIANGNYNTNTQQFNYNVSTLPAGQYFCRVKTDAGVSLKRFMVVK